MSKVNLSAFIYGLFYEDPSVKKNEDKLTSKLFVHKALHCALDHVCFQNILELYQHYDQNVWSVLTLQSCFILSLHHENVKYVLNPYTDPRVK